MCGHVFIHVILETHWVINLLIMLFFSPLFSFPFSTSLSSFILSSHLLFSFLHFSLLFSSFTFLFSSLLSSSTTSTSPISLSQLILLLSSLYFTSPTLLFYLIFSFLICISQPLTNNHSESVTRRKRLKWFNSIKISTFVFDFCFISFLVRK